MIVKKLSFFLWISAALVILNVNSSYSQIGAKINVAAGIVTTNIIGSNRATSPIGPTSAAEEAFIGGSLRNAQPGISLKGTYLFDDMTDLRLTTTLDYMFFSGKEKYGVPPNVSIAYVHDLNIASFGIGLEYVWANLDFANAKLYSGFDIRSNFVHNSYFKETIRYLDKFKDDDIFEAGKDDALRFGGNIRLGVEGRLRNKIYVNTGLSVGVLNLIGRDDSRGELLTPLAIFENEENMLSVFQIFILIQYNM